jgi:hypothetical protein
LLVSSSEQIGIGIGIGSRNDWHYGKMGWQECQLKGKPLTP